MSPSERYTSRIKGLLWYLLGIPVTVAAFLLACGCVALAWHWMVRAVAGG